MTGLLEWVPLPEARGGKCPITSLGRTAMHRLCVPCGRNNLKPPVKSKVFKLPGEKAGRRLINVASLREWFNKQGEEVEG